MSLLSGLLLAQLAWAQDVRVTSTMQPLQLTGAPLVADLDIHNPGLSAIRFPDLAARPDLVRFELTYGGKRERRYNTAKEQPPSAMWTLEAGDHRELRLEVPATAGLKPGPIQVAISLHHQKPVTSLPALNLRLQSPSPVAGDLSGAASAPGTRHPDVAWVHQDGERVHLVLHHTHGARSYELVLGKLPGPVELWLSRSRLDMLGERSILWQAAPQQLTVLRLRGQRTRGKPRTYDLPWPKVELAGHPVTDSSGTLQAPIWIPAPSGTGGELRLVSFRDPSGPSFQRMTRLDQRPQQVLSTVDAAGSGIFYVVHKDAVEVYSPALQPTLPLTRRTLWKSQDASTALRVALGALPKGSVHRGGTAVLLATRIPDGIQTQWLSVKGEALEVPAITEDLGSLTQLVARGPDWPGLVFQDGETTRLCAGAEILPLSGAGTLLPGPSGAVIWRTLTQDGPVSDRPIQLSE